MDLCIRVYSSVAYDRLGRRDGFLSRTRDFETREEVRAYIESETLESAEKDEDFKVTKVCIIHEEDITKEFVS